MSKGRRSYARWIDVLVVVILVLSGVGFWRGIVAIAGKRAQELVAITVAGQERWTYAAAELMLAHLANLNEVKKLDVNSCLSLTSDFSNGKGLIAVLAVGDKNGEPVCTADRTITTKLPTMVDRLYFQKVKNSTGLVVGGYEVSKTTGKGVIHYAYPITDKQGKFNGFVLLGIDLSWFPQQVVDQVFSGKGTKVTAVDRNGKILYSYPSSEDKAGQYAVSLPLLTQLLKDDWSYKYLQGYDGKYRVYAHSPIGSKQDGAIVYAGISLSDYGYIWWLYVMFVVTTVIMWRLIRGLSRA